MVAAAPAFILMIGLGAWARTCGELGRTTAAALVAARAPPSLGAAELAIIDLAVGFFVAFNKTKSFIPSSKRDCRGLAC